MCREYHGIAVMAMGCSEPSNRGVSCRPEGAAGSTRLTQTGPPPGDAQRSRWVATLKSTLAHRTWEFRWSWSFLELDLHLSVGSPSAGWDSLAELELCAESGHSGLTVGSFNWPTVYFANAFSPIKLSGGEDFGY